MRFIWTILPLLMLPVLTMGQTKKIMDESVYDEWKRIKKTQISNSGDWVCYETEQTESDPQFYIYNTRTKQTKSFDRANSAQIDFDEQFIAFLIHPARDSIRAWKRAKIKKKDFVKDTLAIFNLKDQKLSKIPNVNSYKMPTKWGSVIAYLSSEKLDSTKKEKKIMVVSNPITKRNLSFNKVKHFKFAEQAPKLVFNSDKTKQVESSLNYFDCLTFSNTIISHYEGECNNLGISQGGETVSFLIDPDTLKLLPSKLSLFAWQVNQKQPRKILEYKDQILPQGYTVSKYSDLDFSEDGQSLFFGVTPLPLVKDTTLIDEEIVNVEVWTYLDQTLYTQQENNKKKDKEKYFLAQFDLEADKFIQLGSTEVPYVRTDDEKNNANFLGLNDAHYRMYISSHGYAYNDFYLVSKKSGKAKQILIKEQGRPSMSPSGNFSIWFNREQQIWKSLNMNTGRVVELTKETQKFSDELNDRPMDPWSYGRAFWTENDEAVYIYDRYDLWKFDPDGEEKIKRITKGRKSKTVYRYVELTDEDFELDDAQVLLHRFNEIDKSSGYVRLDLESGKTTAIEHGPYQYTKSVKQAKNSNDIVFTKESFNVFPDLIHTKMDQFENQNRVSNVNPQQSAYNWGNIELINWISNEGEEMSGMIVKPEDFDPSKKYPVIINFYERSSNGLHRHRAPYPHRSTINYTYYANRGYVIFNPDVYYDIGYPGRSALETVLSGTEEIKKFPWVDHERIGLQGHSWGGYQVAHILTKTDIFACAESGAPVVNMVSAYGGIRWGSGMSRMFQYERTQSRLGGTLWEKPELYLENSPIFNLDKHVTPVLILHNDKDGAVPWYQGIEYFVGLRRLGRPAWFLNYNDEPHWPLKLQNRLDFNKRMQQFFDHYLKSAAMPSWMNRGIPELEKGINRGFELIED